MCIFFFYREADMTKERIEKLLKAGANVILTTKGIDDMALKVRFCSFSNLYRSFVVDYFDYPHRFMLFVPPIDK